MLKSEKKDVELLNYAQPFINALKTIPGAEVLSQPSRGMNFMKWSLYARFRKQVFAP